jgi:NADPH-dependent curcumin reductase CurA
VGCGVCKVIQSTHPGFQEGDFVWGLTGWEEYTITITSSSHSWIEFIGFASLA